MVCATVAVADLAAIVSTRAPAAPLARLKSPDTSATAAATATVNWRNPRIHSADRVKVWLACDDHVDYLRDYLATRDFPVVVTPHDVTVDAV